MSNKAEKLEQIKSTEKIFMIEVVIQKVYLDVIDNYDLAFRNADTCLSYNFLEYGPFKICERDFKNRTISGGCAGCDAVKNGNSTMFPLFPDQIYDLKKEGFQLEMSVLKMFKLAPKTVGTTEVPMKDIFGAVIDHMARKYVETVSKSMKNRYKLIDKEGEPVGYVDLFVRLSSMGKMIITKFQMDTSKECMEFKSNAGNTYLYKKRVFPDPYLCRPCGQPAKTFPAHEREPALPKEFPVFKVTAEMKERLESRRNQEIRIATEKKKPSPTNSMGKNRKSKSKEETNKNKE